MHKGLKGRNIGGEGVHTGADYLAPLGLIDEGATFTLPSPLGWAEGARTFGPEASDGFELGRLRRWNHVPVRGRLEARRGRPSSAQGIALG